MPRLPPTAHVTALCALAGGLIGCGGLGGGGGGGYNLPNRGIAPYVRVDLGDAETPVLHVLAPDEADLTELREPSGLVDGDRVVLFFEVRDRATGAAYIARSSSDASGAVFGAQEPVLLPQDVGAWALDRVGAPSVIQTPDGWLMAFAYGDGDGIGLARSDDGIDFVADPAPLLAREPSTELRVDSPSIARFDGRLLLYYETLAAAEGATLSIARAQIDGASATPQGLILQAGSDCLGADGAADPCWDRSGVGSPEVRASRTATGRTVLRLFYAGYAGKRADLGFAASFDGAQWSRFVFNPVVAEKADEREATNLRFGSEYLLYFVEVGTAAQHGIALSVNDAGVPSETF
ncbi:MAG: exo-alpha-sialidase [Myxococcota bacterium]